MHTPEYSCDTMILSAVLVTDTTPEGTLENGAVAIRDGKVVGVGCQDLLKVWSAKETIDLGNSLVMPGLVNAHTHSSMTFLRGLADDLPLMQWLQDHIFPVEKHLVPEIVELGCLLGCAEMIRTGTTAFSDMYLMQDAVSRAVQASGLRAAAGEVIFSFPSPAYANPEQAFDLVRRQASNLAGNRRIRTVVMPHATYTTSPEILLTCKALAEELGLPLYLHLAETLAETAETLKTTGKRPVGYCRSLGILDSRVTIAHGVDLTGEELDILAETGVRVAHNPKSNMKLASGVARVPDMLARGIAVGLGTDGAASNNMLNLFSEMTACALLHKVTNADPTCMPASTVLALATTGSAACLHWEELGRLRAGGPADLIALDLDAPNMQPCYNPVSQLVYAATGMEVRLTMVDGEILYRDGNYTTIDYPSLLREMARVKGWALEQGRKRGGF